MTSDTVTIMRAMRYAAHCHRNQRRRGIDANPYINHPIEVAEHLASCGVTDTETIVAALLHDVIEDTDGTYDEICQLFGKIIADIVVECSDDTALDKLSRKKEQIRRASVISNRARLIKLADKYSNISGLKTYPPIGWTEDVISGYIYWSLAVCRKLFGISSCMDKTLLDMFTSFGVDISISDDELEKHVERYYGIIGMG